jgi:putative transposase
MAEFIPNSPRRDRRSIQKIVDAFLGGKGLPFARIFASERIERVFRKHGCWFGLHGVYTTAIMVWSFLSQVLRDGKEAFCQAAVASVVGYCQLQGLQTPTEDT